MASRERHLDAAYLGGATPWITSSGVIVITRCGRGGRQSCRNCGGGGSVSGSGGWPDERRRSAPLARHGPHTHPAGMFVVTEAEAAAIRAVYSGFSEVGVWYVAE